MCEIILWHCVVWFWICFVVAGYFIVRNECVYQYRIHLIEKDYDRYLKLPSYHTMVLKYWWKWNFKDFEEAENE